MGAERHRAPVRMLDRNRRCGRGRVHHRGGRCGFLSGPARSSRRPGRAGSPFFAGMDRMQADRHRPPLDAMRQAAGERFAGRKAGIRPCCINRTDRPCVSKAGARGTSLSAAMVAGETESGTGCEQHCEAAIRSVGFCSRTSRWTSGFKAGVRSVSFPMAVHHLNRTDGHGHAAPAMHRPRKGFENLDGR